MFNIIQKIGRGSSGNVYKALNKEDNHIYAIKQSLSKENDDLIKNEINVYKAINNKCDNICKFFDFFQAKNEYGIDCLGIELEYCEYGSIREIIKKGEKMNIIINEIELSCIIYYVLKGIKFLHDLNFIIRDIKGKNILVSRDGGIKLCDFGICRNYEELKIKDSRGGSPYWMAPEI